MSETKELVTKETLRERKRISRNSESSVTNTILYILIKQCGAKISFRKTKKTKNTIKMLIPDIIEMNGLKIDSNSIDELNFKMLTEIMKIQPKNVEEMNNKQYIRSKEARVNNSLLFLIHCLGYRFDVKQTKRSKLTEKFIRINSLTLINKEFLNLERMNEIGEKFEKVVSDLFGRDFYVVIDSTNLEGLYFEEIDGNYNYTSYQTLNTPMNQNFIENCYDNGDINCLNNTYVNNSVSNNTFSTYSGYDNNSYLNQQDTLSFCYYDPLSQMYYCVGNNDNTFNQ